MATLITTADEIHALVQLTQRIPMTRAEALFIEALFNSWLDQLAQPGAAAGGDVLHPGALGTPGTPPQPPADQHIEQPREAVPAGAPLTKPGDQVQSP